MLQFFPCLFFYKTRKIYWQFLSLNQAINHQIKTQSPCKFTSHMCLHSSLKISKTLNYRSKEVENLHKTHKIKDHFDNWRVHAIDDLIIEANCTPKKAETSNCKLIVHFMVQSIRHVGNRSKTNCRFLAIFRW